MSITDIEPIDHTTIRIACDNIRQKLDAVLSHADSALRQIRPIVRKHKRPNIAAELGPHGPILLSVYNLLKQAREIGKDITIDDLP